MSTVELDRFKKILQRNGNFITKARLRLYGNLQNQSALTMKDLITMTPAHDQTTVYRNVDLFEKLGVINKVRLGWTTKIELSDIFQHHHHHLSCTTCGKVWALAEDSLLETKIDTIARAQGFQPMEHELEIRGTCKDCESSRKIMEPRNNRGSREVSHFQININ